MLDRSKPTPSTYLVRAVPCNQSLHRFTSLQIPCVCGEMIQFFNKHSGFKLHVFSDESNVKHIQTATIVMLGAPSAKQIKQKHHDDTLQGCNLLIARAVFSLVHCCCCYVAGAVILLILFLFLTHMQKICVLVSLSLLSLSLSLLLLLLSFQLWHKFRFIRRFCYTQREARWGFGLEFQVKFMISPTYVVESRSRNAVLIEIWPILFKKPWELNLYISVI